VLVRPETVLHRHRQDWRLFWRWQSRTRLGRPNLSKEVRDLIATMSRENMLWGTERVRGELRTLGIEVSNRSIRRCRWRAPGRPPSQTWRTFLANHARQLWAGDLFTVPTLSFRTLSVLFFIGHGRGEVLHFRVTAHPTAAWVWQQLLNATPWGRSPRYLLHDRDRVYGGDFGAKLKRLGVEQVLTPVRAPRANAVAERMVGTFRRECLDHVVVVNEPHLHALLAEFTAYYIQHRPHRTLLWEGKSLFIRQRRPCDASYRVRYGRRAGAHASLRTGRWRVCTVLSPRGHIAHPCPRRGYWLRRAHGRGVSTRTSTGCCASGGSRWL
jgi:putative transposase